MFYTYSHSQMREWHPSVISWCQNVTGGHNGTNTVANQPLPWLSLSASTYSDPHHGTLSRSDTLQKVVQQFAPLSHMTALSHPSHHLTACIMYYSISVAHIGCIQPSSDKTKVSGSTSKPQVPTHSITNSLTSPNPPNGQSLVSLLTPVRQLCTVTNNRSS